jgi:hypothetical protein
VRASFKAEAIGLTPMLARTARQIGIDREMHRKTRPWVAELLGLDDRHGYRRRFLKAKVDYSEANGAGTRGVWYYWLLESGKVYEARFRTSWSMNMHTRFVLVDDAGEIVDIPPTEIDDLLTGRTGDA